jgi:hypothetical protein
MQMSEQCEFFLWKLERGTNSNEGRCVFFLDTCWILGSVCNLIIEAHNNSVFA